MFRSLPALGAALLVSACSSDVISADSAESHSLDSALARDVMLASHDPPFDSIVEDTAEPTTPLALKILDPIPVESARIRSRTVATVPAVTAETRELLAPRVERRVEPRKPQPPRTRVAIAPAGTQLAVESSRRICVNNSKVGERFNARLARSLSLKSGVTLPRGARVNGEVTSLFGRLGEERLEVSLRTVTVGGKSYQVRSEVTDIELDRTPGAERCIPDDGLITARLVQPLRITAS
jgi:hypothetical protein